jgi:probable phosphoglycerate mutase
MELPFESGLRRRIFLLRHAEAAYGATGGPEDSRLVSLTTLGREQASGMADLLADTNIDRAVCSGLPRTRETAEIVIGARELTLEEVPELEEIRPIARSNRTLDGIQRELAYTLWDAKKPEGSFLGGERFADLWGRVIPALERLLADADWSRMLLVCHGVVNRVILSWALGAELGSLPNMEQDSCCLNVIDIDASDETGEMIRRIVRVLNLTPYDLPKANQVLTTLERQAKQLQDASRRS